MDFYKFITKLKNLTGNTKLMFVMIKNVYLINLKYFKSHPKKCIKNKLIN